METLSIITKPARKKRVSKPQAKDILLQITSLVYDLNHVLPVHQNTLCDYSGHVYKVHVRIINTECDQLWSACAYIEGSLADRKKAMKIIASLEKALVRQSIPTEKFSPF